MPPFYLGGKHQAYNDKRDMFPEAVRAVREVRPKVFIFENVRGLLQKSFNEYFNYILLQLQPPEIIKAENMTWMGHLALLEKHHTAGMKMDCLITSSGSNPYGTACLKVSETILPAVAVAA